MTVFAWVRIPERVPNPTGAGSGFTTLITYRKVHAIFIIWYIKQWSRKCPVWLLRLRVIGIRGGGGGDRLQKIVTVVQAILLGTDLISVKLKKCAMEKKQLNLLISY